MHWVNNYIGKPYSFTDGYNCASLVYTILTKEFNKNIPEINNKNLKKIAKLTQFIKSPEHGAIAVMKSMENHVGIWLDIDNGGILHAIENIGVIFQNKIHLRASGWLKINYYRIK